MNEAGKETEIHGMKHTLSMLIASRSSTYELHKFVLLVPGQASGAPPPPQPAPPAEICHHVGKAGYHLAQRPRGALGFGDFHGETGRLRGLCLLMTLDRPSII